MYEYSQDLFERRCGVSTQQKRDNVEKRFAGLLRCTVYHINYIHIYSVYTNTIDSIVKIHVVSPPSKIGKC